MSELKSCPFCGRNDMFIGVHDDEGNYKGRLGCEYESDPWSGLSYALHHEGWGDCILCSDGANEPMGGVLFDTADEALETWNMRAKGEDDIKPLSNADYIRSMSDKELAHWMSVDFCHGQAEKPLLKWLKAPVEEGYYD